MPLDHVSAQTKLRVAIGASVAAAAAAVALYRRRRQWERINPLIEELWLFPVKGCRGVSVQEAELVEHGFKYDREWVVLKDDEAHTVLTLRNCPRLALVHITIDEDHGALVLSSAEHGSVVVPLTPPAGSTTEPVKYELWGLPGFALHEGPQVAAWLSGVCGAKASLYRVVGPRDPRESKHGIVPPGKTVLAHDFSTVMAISSSTVRQVRDACGDPTVNEHRFRGNIVLATPGARVEEAYRQLSCNGVRFFFSKYCTRCSVPAVRDDGTPHPRMEPTRTLRERFSARPLHHPEADAKPVAGINLFHTGTGIVRVGERMHVDAIGEMPALMAATKADN